MNFTLTFVIRDEDLCDEEYTTQSMPTHDISRLSQFSRGMAKNRRHSMEIHDGLRLKAQ